MITSCGDRSSAESELCTTQQAVLRGTLAPGDKLDTVGSIGTLDADGVFHPRCSGTLLAADLVLTAKHCLLGYEEARNYFGVGGDGDAPRSVNPIAEGSGATPHRGSVAQVGSDVGVYRLEEPLVRDDFPHISEMVLTDALLGAELLVLGYGPDPFDCSATGRALRRSGTEVLGSLAGNVYDFIYGDKAAYLRSAVAGTNLQRASLRYGNGALLPGYEAWVEPGSAGTLTCKGDSGGPVFFNRDGNIEIVGVTSWSASSSTQECEHGAVVAIFGPETRTLLERLLEAQ